MIKTHQTKSKQELFALIKITLQQTNKTQNKTKNPTANIINY